MQKRKLIFTVLAALLISGCNNNASSSAPTSLDKSSETTESTSESSEVTETTSESEIVDELSKEERVEAAFRNLYFAPALTIEMDAPSLTLEQEKFTEENVPVEDSFTSTEMSLSGLTEITNRADENVIFKQQISAGYDEEETSILSYYALETLYVKIDQNNENIQKIALTNAAILQYIFGHSAQEDGNPDFFDTFIDDKSATYYVVDNKLFYTRTITNMQIATILARIIIASFPTDDASEQLISLLFGIIMQNFFHFETFEITLMINEANEIENINLDFEVHITIAENLPSLEEFSFSSEDIAKIITQIAEAKKGERTEAVVSGEIVADVTISEYIDIIEPDNLEEYEIINSNI